MSKPDSCRYRYVSIYIYIYTVYIRFSSVKLAKLSQVDFCPSHTYIYIYLYMHIRITYVRRYRNIGKDYTLNVCVRESAIITSEVSHDAGKRGRSITLKIIRPWMAGSGEQPTGQS